MYVAESKRLTHQGAKRIMTTVLDKANEAGIAISCASVTAPSNCTAVPSAFRIG
jgi:hypothetical protein